MTIARAIRDAWMRWQGCPEEDIDIDCRKNESPDFEEELENVKACFEIEKLQAKIG